jgi:outer membrane protein OmpA-like peptidoglycan-associated protein
VKAATARPALFQGVPVWSIIDDLNAPDGLDERLLRPTSRGLSEAGLWPIDGLPLLVRNDTDFVRGDGKPIALDEWERFYRDLLNVAQKLQDPRYAGFAEALRLPRLSSPSYYLQDTRIVIAHWGVQGTNDTCTLADLIAEVGAFKPAVTNTPSQQSRSVSSLAAGRGSNRDARKSFGAVWLGILLLLLVIGILLAVRRYTQKGAPPQPLASTAVSTSTTLDTSAPTEVGIDAMATIRPALMPIETNEVSIRGERVELRDPIHFSLGSSILTEADRKSLAALAKVLREHPEVGRLRIDGHADPSGDENRNFILSTARVLAVRKALTSAGLDEARIGIDAHGNARLQDKTSAERRRVEFSLEP